MLAQTIWTGDNIVFTKAPNADWTLEANQDRITDDIWLTRKNNQGLFNINQEDGYVTEVSPTGTEWAFGTTADINNLTFTDWETSHGSNPPSTVDQDMVLHLIDEDIYIDIRFTQWGQQGGGGGSFTYERSTDQNLNVASFDQDGVQLFPNPARDFIEVRGLDSQAQITIYNVIGKKVKQQTIQPKQKINLSDLSPGIYLCKVNDTTFKLLKQ
ncbi:hypothetical protein GCM10009117_09970 [Gangjinia marincola]|uniref:Secretion system C-terminal sorting domain-containing protein n=2 Tax=Gangjinia marincola TaxID=578463 RepID=A0ABN1MFD7_9FLAO